MNFSYQMPGNRNLHLAEIFYFTTALVLFKNKYKVLLLVLS